MLEKENNNDDLEIHTILSSKPCVRKNMKIQKDRGV